MSMHNNTGLNVRRKTAALAAVLAVGAASLTVATSPVSAGGSVCAWIGAAAPPKPAGVISLQQRCGVSGTYHMDIWGAGHKRTHTPNYHYSGGTREHFFNWNIPSGAQVCGELWYHKPGGGYESRGLPCWSRP